MAPKSIRITSNGETMPYRVEVFITTPVNGYWLKTDFNSGQTPGTVEVRIDPTGLAAGVYTAHLLFTSGSAVAPLPVPVTFVVGCGYTGCDQPSPTGFVLTNSASFRPGGSPGAAQTVLELI